MIALSKLMKSNNILLSKFTGDGTQTQTKSSDESNRNAICPWEDE